MPAPNRQLLSRRRRSCSNMRSGVFTSPGNGSADESDPPNRSPPCTCCHNNRPRAASRLVIRNPPSTVALLRLFGISQHTLHERVRVAALHGQPGRDGVEALPRINGDPQFFQMLAHDRLAPVFIVVAWHADRYGRRQCKSPVDDVVARCEAEVLPSALPAAALVPGWKGNSSRGDIRHRNTGQTVRDGPRTSQTKREDRPTGITDR